MRRCARHFSISYSRSSSPRSRHCPAAAAAGGARAAAAAGPPAAAAAGASSSSSSSSDDESDGEDAFADAGEASDGEASGDFFLAA